MKGKTTNPTKHADCSTSDTPGSPASFLPAFPFNVIIVGIAAINGVCVAVNSTSSVIVDECETNISIPEAIKDVNDSIFSTTETIIDGAPAIIPGAQIVLSGTEIILEVEISPEWPSQDSGRSPKLDWRDGNEQSDLGRGTNHQ